MQEESIIEKTIEKAKKYIETYEELLFLKASAKVSDAASEIISRLLIIPIVVFCLLFVSFAAAYYISAVLHDKYEGFLIVGGFYFVVGISVICFRKIFLAKFLRNKIIEEIFKEK
jgi:hypothetical protein